MVLMRNTKPGDRFIKWLIIMMAPLYVLTIVVLLALVF